MSQAVIDWGDGSTDTNVAVTPSPEGHWAFQGKTHTYASPGTYEVTVTGVDSGSDTTTAVVTAPPPPPASTGATAGAPGTWTPAGSTPPASSSAATGIVASPTTAWTTGQYMQGSAAGAAGQMHWNGTAWVGGITP